MRNRLLAVLLTATLAVSMLVGCGSTNSGKESSQQKESSSAAQQSSEASQQSSAAQQNSEASQQSSAAETPKELTYPLDTDVELTAYIWGGQSLTSAYTDYNDVPFFKGLKEKTGVNITFMSAPVGTNANTAFNLLLQEDELPDIIMGSTTAAELTEWYNDGIIIDLTELMPKYAPDYWEKVEGPTEDPVELKNRTLRTVNGKHLHFSAWRDDIAIASWSGAIFRQDWLDECGLKMPATVEEIDNVARTFKEKYNAQVGGIISSFNNSGFIASGFNAFAGLTCRRYVEDGVIKFANDKDEWRAYVEFLAKWYKDGILEPNITSATTATARQDAIEGKYGIILNTTGNINNYFQKEADENNTGAIWVGMEPLVPEGYEKARYGQTTFGTYLTSGSVITKDCEEEKLEAALNFLNYGYTEAGQLYWNFGEEGVSLEMKDGKPYFTDLVLNDPRGAASGVRDYAGCKDSPTASIQTYAQTAGFNNWGETWMQTTNAYAQHTGGEHLLPNLTFTEEELPIFNDINSTISTYVSENAIKFLVGEIELNDANWEKFKKDIENMGLKQYLKISQDAYDRFLAASK